MRKKVLSLAGVYAASSIGSGFATGQEILQFFSSHGKAGLLGAVINMAVYAALGALLMTQGFDHDLTDTQKTFTFYFGKKASGPALVVFWLFFLGILTIMASGAGETLSQTFGADIYTGRIVFCLIGFFFVTLGLVRFSEYLGILGPFLVIISVLIGLVTFIRNPSLSPSDAQALKASSSWLSSALLYPSFNTIVTFPITCSIGALAEDRKQAALGGILGGVLFGLAVLLLNLGLLSDLTLFSTVQIPTLMMVGNISPDLTGAFSLVIFTGICSSSVPSLWSMGSALSRGDERKMRIICLAISVLTFILSLTDFRTLINTIYPISGYVGFLFILIALARQICNNG